MHPHRNRSTAAHSAPTMAGTILSLVSLLPDGHSALARHARAIAAHGDADAAADVLSRLLDATDCGLALEADGLLDEGFDA